MALCLFSSPSWDQRRRFFHLQFRASRSTLRSGTLFSMIVVLLISGLHCLGVRLGTTTQNILTTLKIGSLLGIILLGVLFGNGDTAHFSPLFACLRAKAARAAPSTTLRCDASVSAGSVPASTHRRTVSSLTPRSRAASAIRNCRHERHSNTASAVPPARGCRNTVPARREPDHGLAQGGYARGVTTTELGLPALRSRSRGASRPGPARRFAARRPLRPGRHGPADLADRPLQPALHLLHARRGPALAARAPSMLTDAEMVRLIAHRRPRPGRPRGALHRRRAAAAPRRSRDVIAAIGRAHRRAPRSRSPPTASASPAAPPRSPPPALDRVNVSLDTLRPDRFAEITRRDRLAEVLAGLAAARSAGLPRSRSTPSSCAGSTTTRPSTAPLRRRPRLPAAVHRADAARAQHAGTAPRWSRRPRSSTPCAPRSP